MRIQFIRYKVIIILLIGILTGITLFYSKLGLSAEESILFGWMTFGGLYLLESLIIIFMTNSKRIALHAKSEDLGVWFQFAMLIATCSTALVGLIFMRKESAYFHSTLVQGAIFIVSISLAWFVLHLSFVFRYAHLYYGDENKKYARHARGFDFPDDEHPDYIDFAYYSFTIGMTFQVSDVTVKTKGLRRLTLVHALFSFLFNTILVALTINEVLSL